MNRDNEKIANKLSPFLAVILGLFIGFLILLFSGYDAINGYKQLFLGGFEGMFTGDFKKIGNTLAQMTPLIFTGISVAFAFRTGLFNIGAAGQFLVGGFGAVLCGVLLDLPPIIHPIACLISAFVFGSLWGGIPGYLKAKFNIHEVVIGIMLNYTAMWLVSLFAKILIPNDKYVTETAQIKDTASLKWSFLTTITDGSYISMGFFLGILTLIIIYIILEKTTFGYELKTVGYNKNAALYSGIKVERNIIYSMMIAGGLAGLGGASYYIGYTNHIKLAVLPSYGFDGISVALLGLNTPLGVFFSAFLFGYLKNASVFMEATTEIPKEIVDIVTASIIYFSAIYIFIKEIILKILPKEKNLTKETSIDEQNKKGGENI